MPDATVGTVGLPPAGHARREELKKRTDTLAPQAEAANAAVEGATAVDWSRVEPEREIMQYRDELSVSNKQDDYCYAWVNVDYPLNAKGLKVREKLALKGWDVVKGDNPEAIELKQTDGTRRLGDVILMRVKRDRFLELEAAEAAKRKAQQQSVTSNLEQLGQKYRRHGLIVHAGSNLNPDMLNVMQNRARGAMAAREQLDQGLRDGSLNL